MPSIDDDDVFDHLDQSPAVVGAPRTMAEPPRPTSRPAATTTSMDVQVPTFKYQVLSEPAAITEETPLASAHLITNSQIQVDERVRLELERQRVNFELDRERLQFLERQLAALHLQQQPQQQEQQQQQQQQPAAPVGGSLSKKRWIGGIVVVVLLLLVVAAVVGGVCESGNCRGSSPTPPPLPTSAPLVVPTAALFLVPLAVPSAVPERGSAETTAPAVVNLVPVLLMNPTGLINHPTHSSIEIAPTAHVVTDPGRDSIFISTSAPPSIDKSTPAPS